MRVRLLRVQKKRAELREINSQGSSPGYSLSYKRHNLVQEGGTPPHRYSSEQTVIVMSTLNTITVRLNGIYWQARANLLVSRHSELAYYDSYVGGDTLFRLICPKISQTED